MWERERDIPCWGITKQSGDVLTAVLQAPFRKGLRPVLQNERAGLSDQTPAGRFKVCRQLVRTHPAHPQAADKNNKVPGRTKSSHQPQRKPPMKKP